MNFKSLALAVVIGTAPLGTGRSGWAMPMPAGCGVAVASGPAPKSDPDPGPPPVPVPTPPPAPGPASVVPKVHVTGPSDREAYRAILLSGKGSVTVAPLQWKLLNYAPAKPEYGKAPNELIVFDVGGQRSQGAFVLDPAPGEYFFATVATGTDNDADGVPDIDVDISIVTVHDVPAPPVSPPAPEPTPTPTPDPTVNPTPLPSPQRGGLHVTLVYDPASTDVAIRADATMRASIHAAGGTWRAYSVTSTDLDKYNLRATVAAAGPPPLVIVQDSGGHVIGTTRAVATSADVVAYVRSLSGK